MSRRKTCRISNVDQALALDPDEAGSEEVQLGFPERVRIVKSRPINPQPGLRDTAIAGLCSTHLQAVRGWLALRVDRTLGFGGESGLTIRSLRATRTGYGLEWTESMTSSAVARDRGRHG
ncbi:hypothetical protein V8C44DRAFT_330927 [Trichoderma aethiopicum]